MVVVKHSLLCYLRNLMEICEKNFKVIVTKRLAFWTTLSIYVIELLNTPQRTVLFPNKNIFQWRGHPIHKRLHLTVRGVKKSSRLRRLGVVCLVHESFPIAV